MWAGQGPQVLSYSFYYLAECCFLARIPANGRAGTDRRLVPTAFQTGMGVPVISGTSSRRGGLTPTVRPLGAALLRRLNGKATAWDHRRNSEAAEKVPVVIPHPNTAQSTFGLPLND